MCNDEFNGVLASVVFLTPSSFSCDVCPLLGSEERGGEGGLSTDNAFCPLFFMDILR